MKLLIAFGLLCLWPVHIGWCQSADKKAEIAKLRSELSQALEASDAGPPGVITQPVWTKQAQGPATVSKVIVDEAALRSAAALRDEIQKAVAQQGHTKEVLQLDAAIKAAGNAQVGSTLGDARQEMLGASQAPVDGQPNVVESSVNTPGIDLEQLQRLELSKRRTRDLLVLSGIEEDTQFTLGSDVVQWVSVQANGSAYLVGLQPKDLLVLNGDFSPLQTVPLVAPVDAMLSLERWSSHTQLQEGLLVVATQQQLLWHRLEPGRGLVPFWHWPLGSQASQLATFSLEGRDFVVLAGNRTLSVYSYDLEAEEFWIAQRLQLPETITAMAVLDTGRELLLAVGQTDVALIYAYNPRERPLGEAGLQLQLHQRVPAPQVAAIAAFQMGGRSYLALGGQRPQILAHVQGQLVPRTILGQNFGFVELFLPVAVRSYRDDLLLLVQHRVAFDTHTLLVLEVLIWTGEAFEAGLPPPCGIASQPNHITHGAGCMLDHEREAGLIGAALIRQQDQPPLLLVPRQEAPSGLFRLQTKLLPRNSETKDLQEIHEFMRQWVEEQDAIIRLVEAQLQAPLPKEEEFEEIHTPQLINEAGEIEELFVNDARWTAEDAAIDLRQLLQQIRQLEQELQAGGGAAAATMHRAKRQPETLYNFHYDRLEVDSCEADVLLLEQLNHAPFYVQNKSLLLPAGTLNVQRLELLQLPAQPLHAESHERLQLEGSLACETINGLAWSQLLQDLVWRHRPLQLSQLHVQGAVIFEDALHLSSLNELRFPEDYLWSQGNGTSVVHAPKEFTQTLAANVVDTTGTINEMRPEDAITLSDAQDWPGLVTFSQLEVSEELELNGSAQGRQFEEAPLNPTLLETHHIRTADCHFVQLHVHGSLHLRGGGQLDNDSYDALLGDLLQRSADPSAELLVAGAKRIVGQLQLPVDTHVADSQLSGIPLEHFVTKHTAQMLRNLTQLPAYVYFHRLQLPPGASYDGVQLEQLLGQALRLDGAALSSPGTRLRFAGPAPVLAGGLRLEHSLNQVPLASGYQTLREPLHLQRAGFQRLAAEQAQVGGAVRGLGLLNGQRLGDLLQEEPHSWSGEVHVQELILPHGVQAQELQGIRAELLLDFLQQLDELPLLILQGQLQVERIAVSGSVQVEGALNGRDLEQLQREVIWLDRSNEMRTRWQLQQPPVFASDLHILGSFNERLLPELLADIVFRSDSDSDSASAGEVIIEGTKSFTAPLRVADELHLEALNGVPFERLANRRQPLNLAGNVRLQGRLQAASVQLRGALNNDPLALPQLEQLLHWDAQRQAFVQRGRVALLPGGASRPLEDLTVLGHLGTLNEEPLQQLFEQIIFKQQPHIRIDGHKLFTGRVSMPEGAHIQQLNGLDLQQLLSQLIFIDGEQQQQQEQPQEVETPVHFAAPIQMEQLLAERLLLTGQLLNGCNISDWLLDTVRVDRDWQGSAAQAPITFAAGSLDHNSLQLEQLNHLNLSHLVTLHTEQQLLAPFIAEELLLDGVMEVQGLVNGRKLSQEYANTLMINSPVPQTVETPLLLPGIHVRGPLQVKAPINGDASLNLSDVASLEEPQLRLQSPLYFSRLQAPALTARQRLNAFDYVDWHARSLWARGRPEQTISGNWRVKQLRVKQAALGDARNRRQTMEQMEQHYRQLCQRLSKMFGSLRLPYQVQKLKRSFTLRQPKGSEDVRRIFGLEADLQPGGPSSYLLVNERGCWTRIHRWNGTRFAHAGAFRSGPVDEVIGLQLRNNSGRDFAFMTSHEMDEGEHESTWNCTGAAAAAAAASVLQSWHTDEEQAETEPLAIPVETLQGLKQQQKELQKRPLPGSYQAAIKYLQRPPVESELGPHWGRRQQIGPEELHALRRRLLETLNFRLQTEVNITQLSIPESDLYDEQLVEDFLQLMQQLRGFRPRLHADTLPLPDSPARVLAARSAQLIWPVLQELRELAADDGSELALEETLLDVLELANNGSSDQTLQLHAVIGRLRQLQEQLQQQHGEPMASASSRVSEQTLLHWRPVQTLRLLVGPKNRSRLLYARLTRLDPHEGDGPTTPSSAPPAHIQLHHANGSLFQSLAADRQARQLTALRVRDETLLAFVEGCCQIRVFIYRGVQGFVPFARFRAHRASEESPVVQLLAFRLPLQRSPGAVYALAVAQARRITFYELVIAGQLEPWLKCN